MAEEQDTVSTADATLELKVDNMSFLLERLGRDCAPDQLVRELTVNAIQAIQDTGGPGLVVWDHEPTYTRRFGAYKLAIADTGIGMTGPEMVRYINHLAASAREQADDGNFGVGAKIAAATRNAAGMVYLSWRRGEGAMVWLWRNPETGRYGLKRLPREDGTHGYWTPAPAEAKPGCIGEHGTVVVLLGDRADADTMLPPGVDEESPVAGDRTPGGDPSIGLWLTRYLNSRFFRLPDGIEVRARERWGTPASRLRTVRGARRFLDDACEAAGRVDLGDATARWWILPEGDAPGAAGARGALAARNPAGGHVGALYQDELYERYTGRSGTAKLQSFGIAVGHHRVVLYIEPRTDGPRRVTANTARTALLVDGRPLPWGDWADRFREKLPEPLLELMEEVAGARDARDHTRAFKERMKGLASLLMIGAGDPEEALRRVFTPDRGRRRRDRRGEADADAGDAGALRRTAIARAAVEGDAGAAASSADERRDARSDGVKAGGEEGKGEGEGGSGPGGVDDPGRGIDLDRLLDLEIAWVPEAECGAVDRAGHYIGETNTLLVNRDFRVFAEYVDRWREKYAGNPAAEREVEDVVREWLEQPMRELIIRSHFLRGTAGWSDNDIRRLLSDEALTAVSLPCYLTEMRLRRAVSQRLGRLRERPSPERAAA